MLRCLQLNIGRNTARLYEALDKCPERRIDVLFLQDVTELGMLEIEGWAVSFSKAYTPSRSSRLHMKAALCVRCKPGRTINSVLSDSNYITGLLVTDKEQDIQTRTLLISAYAPFTLVNQEETAPLCNPRKHWETLDEIMQKDIDDMIENAGEVDTNIVAGDFNLPEGPWVSTGTGRAAEEERSFRIRNIFAPHGMTCETPTTTITCLAPHAIEGTTIDLVFTNRPLADYSTFDIQSRVDHYPIFFMITLPTRTKPQQEEDEGMPRGPFKWSSYGTALTRALRQKSERDDPNILWSNIESAMRQALREIQEKPRAATMTRKLRTYWTHKLAELHSLRTHLRKDIRKKLNKEHGSGPKTFSFTQRRKEKLRTDKAVRELTAEIKIAIKEAEAAFISERVGKLNTVQEWKALNMIREAETTTAMISPPFQLQEGQTVESKEGKMQALQNVLFPYAVEVESDDGQTDETHRSTQLPTDLPRLKQEEINWALEAMKTNKAPGHDGIKPEMLKRAYASSDICRRQLDKLFRMAVEQGRFPEAWRITRVRIIPKPGPRNYRLPKSYRPISLLSIAARVVDKIVTTRFHSLAGDGLLTHHHYGARPGLSATHATAMILEKGRNVVQAGKALAMATIDVGGAFNNIDHSRLCEEVARKGHLDLATWICNWLQDRKLYMVFEDHRSSQLRLGDRGIPQGSPLSPVLWSIYLDSFFQQSGMPPRIRFQGAYVDDLFALATGASKDDALAGLQEWMDQMAEWSKDRGLSLDKPGFTLYQYKTAKARKKGTDNEPKQRLNLPQGDSVKPNQTIRVLGLTIGEDTSLRQHIAQTTASAIRMAHYLSRKINHLGGAELQVRQKLAEIGPRATLDYAAALLLPLDRIEASMVATADSAIMRLVFGLDPTERQVPRARSLCMEMGWLTSKGRWKKAALRFQAKMFSSGNEIKNYAFKFRDAPERFHEPQHTADTTPYAEEDHRPEFSSADLDRRLRRKKAPCGPLRIAARFPLLPIEACSIPRTKPWDWILLTVEGLHQGKEEGAERVLKEMRKAQEERPRRIAYVFSDGSRLQDKEGTAVGAAVSGLAFRPDQRWSASISLAGGRNGIFDAELRGLLLALESCLENKKDEKPWKQINVFCDSQAALRRLQASWHKDQSAGQDIVNDIRTIVARIRPTTTVVFKWTPGHIGITGNEEADRLAKEAAKERSAEHEGAYSMGVVNEYIDSTVWQDEQDAWAKEASTSIRQLAPTVGKSNGKTYSGVQREAVALLLKWRTNLIRNKTEAHRSCKCGQMEPDRAHYMLECGLLADLRNKIKTIIARDEDLTEKTLLQGGQFNPRDHEERTEYLELLTRFLRKATLIAWHGLDVFTSTQLQRRLGLRRTKQKKTLLYADDHITETATQASALGQGRVNVVWEEATPPSPDPYSQNIRLSYDDLLDYLDNQDGTDRPRPAVTPPSAIPSSQGGWSESTLMNETIDTILNSIPGDNERPSGGHQTTMSEHWEEEEIRGILALRRLEAQIDPNDTIRDDMSETSIDTLMQEDM